MAPSPPAILRHRPADLFHQADRDVIDQDGVRCGDDIAVGGALTVGWTVDGRIVYSTRRFSGLPDTQLAILSADNREELIAATKALDRVLIWNHYLAPGWTLRAARIARWDRFSHPDPLPEYAIGFPQIWWWDEAKAAKVGAAR